MLKHFRGIHSYVLRAGRMSYAQRRSYETLFPRFGVKGDKLNVIDIGEFFDNCNSLVIEIGFGMGTATASIAEQNPEINYLGIEVHKPGIGRLLWEIEKRDIRNIRIAEGDAVEILKQNIKEKSVSAFHVFFPDPWPKKRHHKRRLITRPFTDLLASRLISGGYVYFASDWKEYGEWALGELSATSGFVNKYKAFAEYQEWRPKTEFERKGLSKKHEIWELFFIKSEENK
jgi:tRNA (guanine-N7-)-methyltransferase